jgi:hypothetical protein
MCQYFKHDPLAKASKLSCVSLVFGYKTKIVDNTKKQIHVDPTPFGFSYYDFHQ